MTAPNNLSTHRVSKARIRQIFDGSQHRIAIENGIYREAVTDDSTLQPATARQKGFPVGTRTQFVRYYDSNERYLVGMHRYILPDGTVGASGRADPKYVVIADAIYYI